MCGQASGGSRVGRGSLRGIIAGHKRREQAIPPALVYVAGPGRSEIEEARRPLDGHPTLTAARIVCSLTKPCVNKSASKSVVCIAHLLLFL